MFQTFCFFAFVGNCIMMLASATVDNWWGVLFHFICAILCATGLIELNKKENR